MFKLVLALILSVSVMAWEIQFDIKRLKEKIQGPLPQWAKEQIENELAPYKKRGVRSADLDSTMDAVQQLPNGYNAQLVKYKIQNNKITWTSLNKYENDDRITHVLDFIKSLAKHIQLPNVEILSSLWDSFNDPIFLENVQCPVFTICKRCDNRKAVLWPELREANYKWNIIKAVLWKEKNIDWDTKEKCAFWRGNATNGYYSLDNWDGKPRPRLVLYSFDNPEIVDARFIGTYWTELSLAEWMEKNGFVVPWTYPLTHLKYRYLISVDGNSFASNLYWQLAANSVIIRERSTYIEWFYKGLKDGIHYVSYRSDCRDLKKMVTTLRKNDELAKRIAKQATEFAVNNLSLEDIAAYLYHLLVAYSELFQS